MSGEKKVKYGIKNRVHPILPDLYRLRLVKQQRLFDAVQEFKTHKGVSVVASYSFSLLLSCLNLVLVFDWLSEFCAGWM